MTTEQAPALEELIASWRDWMERRDALSIRDVDELESHLRDRVDALTAAGLTEDEAFLIAVKRLGSMDELSREYAAEHSGRLWKQLVLHDSSDIEGADASSGTIPFVRRANGLAVALVLGVGAGIAVKATELLTDEPELVFRNIAVLVLPFLAAWFAWRRRPPVRTLVGVAAAFARRGARTEPLPVRRRVLDRRGRDGELRDRRARDHRLDRRALARHGHRRRRRRLAERPHPDGLPALQRRVARLLRAHRDRGRRTERAHRRRVRVDPGRRHAVHRRVGAARAGRRARCSSRPGSWARSSASSRTSPRCSRRCSPRSSRS